MTFVHMLVFPSLEILDANNVKFAGLPWFGGEVLLPFW